MLSLADVFVTGGGVPFALHAGLWTLRLCDDGLMWVCIRIHNRRQLGAACQIIRVSALSPQAYAPHSNTNTYPSRQLRHLLLCLELFFRNGLVALSMEFWVLIGLSLTVELHMPTHCPWGTM